MAGFDDLLGQLYEPPEWQSFPEHVAGTSLVLEVTVVDGDLANIDFSSGYTASLVPYVAGVALSQFTQTLTSGRRIILGNGLVTVKATPTASAALFAPYAGLTVVTTLLVTRTSDGETVPLWHDCYLPIRPKLNP